MASIADWLALWDVQMLRVDVIVEAALLTGRDTHGKTYFRR